MTGNMPAAEVDVDVDLVRRLLTSQHPDLADVPIELVTNGWDNVMFRLGDDLAVRVPRRASAVPLIEAEQQWLARFAPSLPVPVPAPVRSATYSTTARIPSSALTSSAVPHRAPMTPASR